MRTGSTLQKRWEKWKLVLPTCGNDWRTEDYTTPSFKLDFSNHFFGIVSILLKKTLPKHFQVIMQILLVLLMPVVKSLILPIIFFEYVSILLKNIAETLTPAWPTFGPLWLGEALANQISNTHAVTFQKLVCAF